MRVASRIQFVAVSLAIAGMCFPQAAFAAAGANAQPGAIADIQLHEGNVLIGQVVTPENRPAADAAVTLHSGNQLLASAKTDAKGVFAFRGLQNGVYQVMTPNGQGTYRVWEPGTAPPAAQAGALIVAGQNTVRGQEAMTGLRNLLANPLVIAGIVAAAVAIPVAIHNSHHAPSSP